MKLYIENNIGSLWTFEGFSNNKLRIIEHTNNPDYWAFDGEDWDQGNFEKSVWLENFDGTSHSVDKVCYILNTHYKKITNAYISNSVTDICQSAFCGCASLKNIIIPNSVGVIGDHAFEGCVSLESINIPDSVTDIGDSAFFGCTSLTNITIGDSVQFIGWDAFGGCTSLKSMTIPDSVMGIGAFAFENTDLTIYTKNPNVINYCKGRKLRYKEV